MDPDDSEASFEYRQTEHTASHIFKTTLLTVALSACHSFEPEPTFTRVATNFTRPQPIVAKTASAPGSKKKKKTIYLTFDDGPNKGTKKMMHVVEEEEIPVTLFIIGEHVYESKSQTEAFDSAIHSRYFEIANHSYTHAFNNKYAKFYQVPDSALNDFKRCADSLHLTANIIRCPGRNIWRMDKINSTDLKASEAAADSFYAKGFKEVGWDLEWQYDKDLKLKQTSDDMVKAVDNMFARNRTKTPGNLVILAHDQVFADDADSTELSQFIKKLKAKNEYDFETVGNYPGIKK
ncbi:MAG TPA: polysaccharide deacetylase family protein [Ferruginibacter sp.]|nr:polysaccharide deacetylase family protein [Ferruginibacter sp.]